MITCLNHQRTTWVKIYKVDMDGYESKYGNWEDYFTQQLETIVEQQHKLGYILRTSTPFNDNWILIFTPNPR